jgi:alkyl hydroperoxide reductase subunit AhpC
MARKVIHQLENGSGRFLIIGDRAINIADLTGVFTDKDVSSVGVTEVIDGTGSVRQLNSPNESAEGDDPITDYDSKYKDSLSKLGYKIE